MKLKCISVIFKTNLVLPSVHLLPQRAMDPQHLGADADRQAEGRLSVATVDT